MTRFQAEVAEYDQFADINLHDTVKIQKLQAAFSGDRELTGKLLVTARSTVKMHALMTLLISSMR